MNAKDFCTKLKRKFPNNPIINQLEEKIHREKIPNSLEKTKVDYPINNTEKKNITSKIEQIKNSNGEFKQNQNFTDSFRLDNALKKGSGHWEIQRNGKTGKTTVAQVHAPNWIQELLNGLNDSKFQKRYENLLCQKLQESLNSGYNEIIKSFVTVDDLDKIFFI